MASNQQFCLRWNNHQSTLISVFDHLLESGTLVDCTLAAEGQFLKAHKVVLSACSPYLEALLSQHYEKHPILILKDVSFHELKSMLDYMYRGEVNISQEQLGTFLKAAESLQIKGLTDSGAMSEARDLERTREMENVRIPGDFGRIDRSLSTVLPKRIENRKQIPILPRPRSPLVGLPTNFIMNTDHRKVNKFPFSHDVNLGTSNMNRNREGSLSPTAKRKRPSSYTSQNEEAHPVENNVGLDQNHHQKKSETSYNSSPAVQSLSNSVPVSSSVSETKKHSESENSVDSEVIKREVKMEKVEFTDEVQNEDSVEDLTVEEEEEEMDEMDLSQPGPSTASNSLVAAVPWHSAGEGSGDDGLLASQQDSQGENWRQKEEIITESKHVLEKNKLREIQPQDSEVPFVDHNVGAVSNLFEDVKERKCKSCAGQLCSDRYIIHDTNCPDVVSLGGKRLECGLCGAMYLMPRHVTAHLKRFCTMNPEVKRRPKLRCKNCNSTFFLEKNLKIHFYTCRKRLGLTKPELAKRKIAVSCKEILQKKCDEELTSHSNEQVSKGIVSLEGQVNNMSNLATLFHDSPFNNTDHNERIKGGGNCKSCDAKKCSDGYFIHDEKCHNVMSLGGKRVECCLCTGIYSSPRHMKTHFKNFCPMNPELKILPKVRCVNCNSTFSGERNLKIHMRITKCENFPL